MKIIDFGLAKLRDATVTLGTTAGTLPYMSPEQTTGADIDHRTDIWSLGTVMYEMLGGRPAFSGDSAAVTYAIAHTDPPRLRDARPDLPGELDRIVHRCLEAAGTRYQRCRCRPLELEGTVVRPKASGVRTRRSRL